MHTLATVYHGKKVLCFACCKREVLLLKMIKMSNVKNKHLKRWLKNVEKHIALRWIAKNTSFPACSMHASHVQKAPLR